jgi:membrane protein YqaA with SNARE-associated domain
MCARPTPPGQANDLIDDRMEQDSGTEQAMSGSDNTARSSGGKNLWQPPLLPGFIWGFAEATLFFIIPDVIIAWAALSGWRSGLRMLLAALAGALVGGLLLYGLAAVRPAAAIAAVESVPFVHHAMIDTVAGRYRELGAPALLLAPGNGIPYKVYAALAPSVTDPVSFALLSVPARLARFLPALLIFTVVGRVFSGSIAGYPGRAAFAFVAVWTVGYAAYWSFI